MGRMNVAPAALVPLLLAALPAQGGGISWLTDLGAARMIAKAQKAPLFVTFRCER